MKTRITDMNPSTFPAKKGVVYRHLHVGANDDIVV